MPYGGSSPSGPRMHGYLRRAVRKALVGSAAGAVTAVFLNVARASLDGVHTLLSRVPATVWNPLRKSSHLPQIICVVVLATALLSWAPLASLLVRAYRSYRAGIITGILPVWYLLSLFLFVGPYNWTTVV